MISMRCNQLEVYTSPVLGKMVCTLKDWDMNALQVYIRQTVTLPAGYHLTEAEAGQS